MEVSMDILKVFESIELTEEQTKALDKFFEDYSKKLKSKIQKEYSESMKGKEQVDIKAYVKKADAEKAFALFEADCRKAFGLFEADAEKAFNLYTEDKEKEFSDKMSVALNELYVDIEKRVQNDFMESKEYKTLKSIKDMVLPLLEGDNNELLTKMKAISEEKQKIEEENKQLQLEKTIHSLVKDIPKEYVEAVTKFIAEGKTEDDVVNRFCSVIEMLEIKEKQNAAVSTAAKEKSQFIRKNKPITEEVKAEPKAKEEKPKRAFSYKTKDEESQDKPKQTGDIKAFTESEEKLLGLINLA
jgi:thiol-disulfide isomerase/thioredoxin